MCTAWTEINLLLPCCGNEQQHSIKSGYNGTRLHDAMACAASRGRSATDAEQLFRAGDQ